MGTAMMIEGEALKEFEARALATMGGLATYAGHEGPALACLTQALELSREIGDLESAARALCGLAALDYKAGSFEPARRLFDEAVMLARALGQYGPLIVFLKNSALNEIALGNYDRAEHM